MGKESTDNFHHRHNFLVELSEVAVDEVVASKTVASKVVVLSEVPALAHFTGTLIRVLNRPRGLSGVGESMP